MRSGAASTVVATGSASPSSTPGAARSSPPHTPLTGERIWDPFVCEPQELAGRIAAIGGPVLCAGSGAVRFREELAGPDVEIPEDADPAHRIAARHICALAAPGAGAEAEPAAPNYLRPPDAERWRERDTIQTPE